MSEVMALFIFNSNEISERISWEYGAYAQGQVLKALYNALLPLGGWEPVPVLHGCHGDLFYENILGEPVGIIKLAEWFRRRTYGIEFTMPDRGARQEMETAGRRIRYIPYAVGIWPLPQAVVRETHQSLLNAQAVGYLGLAQMSRDVGQPRPLDELCMVSNMRIEAGQAEGWKSSTADLAEAGLRATEGGQAGTSISSGGEKEIAAGRPDIVEVLAEKGDAEAQYATGVYYFTGERVSQDCGKAAKWFYEAAVRGHALAQFRLGLLYDRGLGVPQNHEEAAKWFQMAAEQGVPEAQFNLGFMHEHGQGLCQDYDKAVKWYREAAEQGLAEAQVSLGVRCLKDREDWVQAYMWFTIAAAAGHENAQKARDSVAAGMTSSQIEEGEGLARQWIVAIGRQNSTR